MSAKRLFAIAIIYVFTFIAWMILGVSNISRTNKSFRLLKSEVISLYGDAVIINSPKCYSKIKKYKEEIIDGKKIRKEYFETDDYELSKSDVKINIKLDQRKKGNLWFPTFKAEFNGGYEFKIKNIKPNFKFPIWQNSFSNFIVYDECQYYHNYINNYYFNKSIS